MTYDELIKMHPDFFSDNFFIECETGWSGIIEGMLHKIRSHHEIIETIRKMYPERELDYSPIYFLQIKEKFGGLRIYATGGDFYTRGIIDMAEEMARYVCEFSGDKGKIRTRKINEEGVEVSAWVKCMSDEVAKKHGYL
jgi:DNA gyrase/topoisomerase IV subunit A